MIYLMQLLSMIDDLDNFEKFFSDFSEEVDETGYIGSEDEFLGDLLLNHFGIDLENQFQLSRIAKIMMDEKKFKAAIATARILRGQ
jgi:hypothetical protein